jgi:elongation factor P
MGNISVTDARVGQVIVVDGNLMEVTEYNHIKPGKGPAKVRWKLKNVRTGSVLDKTVGVNESVDEVELSLADMQYLYKEGEDFVFMNTETFDQVALPAAILEEGKKYLRENDEVTVTFHGEEALGVRLAAAVVLEVVETDPAVKGNTVNAATKDAVLETGLKIQVPMFVEQGGKVKVDTRTGKYLERA